MAESIWNKVSVRPTQIWCSFSLQYLTNFHEWENDAAKRKRAEQFYVEDVRTATECSPIDWIAL